jgi:NodT family efflux transporter outer membrane factor (OMF) lipoprotein
MGTQAIRSKFSRVRPARLVFVVPLLVAACALRPTPETPHVLGTIADQPAFVALDEPSPALDPAAFEAWWDTIGGAELAELIEALEAENLDLSGARARTDQARARSRQALSGRLPAMGLSVEAGERRGIGSTGPLDWEETYAATAGLTWDLDLFGGARNAHLAARLRFEAQKLGERTLFQALAAETTTGFVRAWTLKRQIEVADASAESFAETARLTDLRYRAGSPSVTALDVQLARQNEAAARAALPELRAALVLQVQGLDLLLGRPIGTTRLTFATPPDVTRLESLGVGVPADLLRRRPDVAAAELAYRAALADVGAARAQLLPSLTLSGSLGQQTGDASALFDPDQMIASLVAGLAAPLYQGGRLRAQVDLAEASARELASAYANAALRAISEVEAALVLEAAYEDELALRWRALEAAQISNRIAQERYASGQAPLLAVLEAQRALNAARLDLVLAEQKRLEARIDLFLALGGDWRMAERIEGAVSHD